MRCAFCGEEFDGRPVRQDGNLFCSTSCADMAAEVGFDDEEDEAGYDDERESGYYDEVEEEEY